VRGNQRNQQRKQQERTCECGAASRGALPVAAQTSTGGETNAARGRVTANSTAVAIRLLASVSSIRALNLATGLLCSLLLVLQAGLCARNVTNTATQSATASQTWRRPRIAE